MKIHAYLLCFNEEQIIRHTIEYYLEFCSRIFVMDNESTDASAEIARSYKNVTVIPWRSNGLFDRKLAARMRSQTYRSYSRAGGQFTQEVADWVIVCDMDEHVYHPDLVGVLENYSKLGVTVPQTTGFEIVDSAEIQPGLPLLDQFKYGYRSTSMDKRLVFNTEFDMSYSHGCHPRGPGFDLMRQTYGYHASNEHPIAVLHYKHLGSRYYTTALKNFQRAEPGSVSKSKDGKYHGVGCHYFQIVEQRLKHSPLLGMARPIFHDGRPRLVRFEDFPPTSGEVGHRLQLEVKLPGRHIEFLRDTAIALESSDLSTALQLMEIAQAACPSGRIIRDKVTEYRGRLSGLGKTA